MISQLQQMVRVFLQTITTMMITTQEAALYPIQELGGIEYVMALISMVNTIMEHMSHTLMGSTGNSSKVIMSH